jgi:2',3'-cyclic-nucleotide 2'-phosphodiesterase (5'-nucleotidase family)
MSEAVADATAELGAKLGEVIAATEVSLTINDPTETDALGKPIRMVRRAETNLGDLVADAFRDQSGADIALIGGGGIRDSIGAGDVTLNDILKVNPFGNYLTVIEVTGQQILDALEWGSKSVPSEDGGFQQVSGLSYEIDASVESGCRKDEDGMFAGIEGERRVRNVLVNGEPIDPEGSYALAGVDYWLLNKGDGFSMFEGAKVLQDRVKLDNQVLIDYITQTLGGVIGAEYEDPYGQGRIVITEKEP